MLAKTNSCTRIRVASITRSRRVNNTDIQHDTVIRKERMNVWSFLFKIARFNVSNPTGSVDKSAQVTTKTIMSNPRNANREMARKKVSGVIR
jgi:hypothetical protein